MITSRYIYRLCLGLLLCYSGTAGASLIIGDSIGRGIATAGKIDSRAQDGIGVDYLASKVLAQVPPGISTVYVSIGTNDYYRGYTTGQYTERLERLEGRLHSQGYTEVCYLLPPPMPQRVEDGLYSIRTALQGRGCTITLPDRYRAQDAIHYTYRGYKIIAERLK